jgi:CHAT domain-containing protein
MGVLAFLRKAIGFAAHPDHLPDNSTTPTAHIAALVNFLAPHDWQHSRIAFDNPCLLEDEAVTALRRLSQNYTRQGDLSHAKACGDHLLLLERCRDVGVNEAFSERISRFGNVKLDHPVDSERLSQALIRLMENHGNMPAILAEESELLSPEAEYRLQLLMVDVPDDSPVNVNAIRRVLAAARYTYTADIGKRHFDSEDWALAADALKQACDAAETLLRTTPTIRDRDELTKMQHQIFQDCAFAFCRAGRTKEAALILESGRARIMGEAVTRERWVHTVYERSEDPLVKRFVAASWELKALQELEYGANEFSAGFIEHRRTTIFYGELERNPAAMEAVYSNLKAFHDKLRSDDQLRLQYEFVWPMYKRHDKFWTSPYFDLSKFKEFLELWNDIGRLGSTVLPELDLPAQIPLDEQFSKALADYELAQIYAGVNTYQVTWNDLIENLGRSVPNAIVYIFVTAKGGGAIIIHNPEAASIKLVELPTLTSAKLRSFLFGATREDASWFRSFSNREILRIPWRTAIVDSIGFAAREVMAPVCQTLREQSVDHAFLVPCGQVSLLPLACAGRINGENTTREIGISIIPSARLLSHALRSKALTEPNSFFGVANPAPSLKAQLELAEEELTLISRHFFTKTDGGQWFGPTTLIGDEAERQQVIMMMPGHDIIHFACHGEVDLVHPDQSAIFVSHDDRFNIKAIINLKASNWQKRGRLAFLSACESGLAPPNTSDEGLGLVGGLMFAGFPAVVASLWPVPEVSTAMLAIKFYDEWLYKGVTAAAALWSAQRWICETMNAEKCQFFATLIELEEGGFPSSVQVEVKSAASRFIAALSGDLTAREFEHPYFWAGFYLGGF